MNTSHDKNRALDNALTLFWSQGYACTSLKDLEHATGMHPGSIYAAFGSKAKLYCAAMDRYVEWIHQARAALVQGERTNLEMLSDFVEYAHPASNPAAPVPACFLVKTTLETGVEQAVIQTKLSALLDENDLLFTRIFAAAIDQGELLSNCSAADLAAQLSADLAGLCYYALRTKNADLTKKMALKLASRIRCGSYAS